MLLTTVLTIYTSIGFGCWLALTAIRLKRHKFKYLMYNTGLGLLKGFVGALLAWPILIFYIEP